MFDGVFLGRSEILDSRCKKTIQGQNIKVFALLSGGLTEYQWLQLNRYSAVNA